MHVVGADAAAIGFFSEAYPDRRAPWSRDRWRRSPLKVASMSAPYAGCGRPDQLGDRLALPQAQRVQVGVLVTAEAEGVDQLQYANLFGIHLGIGNGAL